MVLFRMSCMARSVCAWSLGEGEASDKVERLVSVSVSISVSVSVSLFDSSPPFLVLRGGVTDGFPGTREGMLAVWSGESDTGGAEGASVASVIKGGKSTERIELLLEDRSSWYLNSMRVA